MEELQEKVETLIEKYRKQEDEVSEVKLKKLLLIKKLLENPKCFFEISIEQSISILKTLEIENIEEYYKMLISQENWASK